MGRWKTEGDGWECRPDGHWLVTERLVLRPLTLLDVEPLFAVFDPEVVKWQGYPSDPAALKHLAEGWCANAHNSPHGHPLYPWAICDRSTGELVGTRTVLAYPHGPLRGRRCDTGSSLKQGWRDKGYGTEELRAVIRLVTEHLGFSTILAATSPGNERALRVYRKCGFVDDGVRKGFVLPNGAILDAPRLRRDEPAGRTCRYAIRPRWF